MHTVTPRVGKDGKTYPAKQNKPPKSSPHTKPKKKSITTEPPTTQQAQNSAEPEESLEDLFDRHDDLWRELSKVLTPYRERLSEFRSFYHDTAYTNRVNELFEL